MEENENEIRIPFLDSALHVRQNRCISFLTVGNLQIHRMRIAGVFLLIFRDRFIFRMLHTWESEVCVVNLNFWGLPF